MNSVHKIYKSLVMLDKGLIRIEFIDEGIVEKEGVADLYHLVDELTKGKRYTKLLIIGSHTEISKEARLQIVQENKARKDSIMAEAIVVNSFAQKLSANFYILFLEKIYPTRFFIQEEKAEEWLSTFTANRNEEDDGLMAADEKQS